jgi:hypothetical protein
MIAKVQAETKDKAITASRSILGLGITKVQIAITKPISTYFTTRLHNSRELKEFILFENILFNIY